MVRHQTICKNITNRRDQHLRLLEKKGIVPFGKEDLLYIIPPVIYVKNISNLKLHLTIFLCDLYSFQ